MRYLQSAITIGHSEVFDCPYPRTLIKTIVASKWRHPVHALWLFRTLSRTTVVNSKPKSDWFVDITCYHHVLSTNQSALRIDGTKWQLECVQDFDAGALETRPATWHEYVPFHYIIFSHSVLFAMYWRVPIHIELSPVMCAKKSWWSIYFHWSPATVCRYAYM